MSSWMQPSNAETGCNAKGGGDTTESNGIELNVLAHVLCDVAQTANICPSVNDGMETKLVCCFASRALYFLVGFKSTRR